MVRRAVPLWSLLLAVTLLGSCLDAPTAPRAEGGSVALAPRFAHAIAAGLVDVISVRVSLRRPGSSVAVVDSVIVFPVGSDEVELRLTAPVNGGSEEFELFLAMMNAIGDTVFRSGPELVTLTTSAEPTVVEPELVYSGPGANATAVRFVEPPTLVNFGDTVVIVAEAVDGQQNPIAGTPIGLALADSADTLRARVTDARAGRLVVGEVRGPVIVRAFTPADLGATHALTVQPVASGIEVVSGDAQSATVATALAAPLVARVVAADGLGVAGVEVVFAVTAGSGSLSIAAASSDANGEVATVLTVGAEPGQQTVRAFLAGVPDFFVEFNATAAAGAPTQLSFAIQPVSGTADAALTAVEVHVLDANGFLVDTSSRVITMTLSVDPTGQNPLGGTLNVAAVNGVAVFNDLALGIAANGYQLDASAAGVASVQSNPFDVAAGAATHLAFAAPPPLAVPVDVPFDVELVARDAGGNVATAFAGTVTLAVAGGPGGATLGGTTGVQAVAGVASFTGLTLDVLATGYVLTASALGLADATSDLFNVEPPPEVNAWTNVTGGNWNIAANWSRGTVPTGTDTVWIRQPGTYTVIVNDTRAIGPVLMGATSGRQTLSIPGGTVTLGDTVVLTASADVVISGGTVGGTGSMLVGGNLTWTGGNLTTSGTVTVQPTATLAISGTTGRNLQNGVLAIGGTATWEGTHTINSGSQGRLRVLADGALDIVGDPSMLYNLGGVAPRLENFGTVRRTTSAGVANITAAFDNTGALIVGSGSLQLGGGGASGGSIEVQPNALLSFTAGTHALSATSTLQLDGRVAHGAGTTTVEGTWNGPGRLQVAGGIFNYSVATGSVDSLVVSGGTLGGAIGSSLNVATAMTWTGGALTTAGTITVQPTATLSISGTTGRNLQNGVLAIGGTATWEGTHTINSGSQGRLRVLAGGTLEIVGNPSMLHNLGGITPRLENFGLVRRTTSAGVALVTVAFDNVSAVEVESGTLRVSGGGASDGSFNVLAGAILDFGGGTHTLNAGSAVGGTGQVRVAAGSVAALGPWNVAGVTAVVGGTLNYSAVGGSTATLNLSGGTLGGATGGALTVSAAMNWTGGNLSGTGGSILVPVGATIDISGTAGRNLAGMTIEVLGAGTWAGTHTINSGSVGRLLVSPSGTLVVSGDPTITHNLGGATPSFEVLGTVTRTTSAGGVIINVPFSLNAPLNVQTGTWDLRAGGTLNAPVTVAGEALLLLTSGTHTMQPTFGASGGGGVRLAGGTLTGLAAADTVLLDQVELAGGTLTVGAGGVVQVGGTLQWGGTTLNGAGTIFVPLAAALDVATTATRTFTATTIDVFGTMTVSAAATINTGSAARLIVQSGALLAFTHPAASTASMPYNLGGAAPLVDVRGELRLNSAASLAFSVPVSVSGLVSVNAGTLNLTGGSTVTGSIVNAAGANTLLNGGIHTLANGASMAGAGVTALSSGSIATATATDTASITTLNLTAGTLAHTGTLSLGTLNWSAGGAVSGTGTTSVLTTLQLTGTAARTFTNGTLENRGTGTRSGTFALNTGSGARFVNYGTYNWTADGSHLYNLGGAVPVFENLGTFQRTGATAASVATIGAQVIDTVSTAFNLDIGELHLTGGGRFGGSPFLGGVLQLAGGAFSMRTGMTWNVDGGVLRLTTGSLTADDGAVITMPPFALLGGTLTHEATLNFNQVFDWTGGTISSNTVGLGGTTRLLDGGAMLIAGTAAKTFSGLHLIETDTLSSLTQSGTGAVNIGSGARILNAGDVQLAGSGGFLYNLGGALPQFENLATGTVRAQGAVTGPIDLPFTNSGGAFEVTGDSLRLTRGSTGAFTGTAVVNTSALVLGGGTFTLSGPLAVSGTAADVAVTGGQLALAGQTVTVGRDFSTRGAGSIASTAVGSVLDVGRNATFAGGASVMTAGTFQLGGNLTQGGATSSFAPSGTHRTVLAGSVADQRIAFASPTTSYFNRLDVQAQERGIVLDTDALVADSLVMLAGAVNYDLVGAGTSQRLRVNGGLRVAEGTGNPLIAPPVLELATAPSIGPSAAGRGMAADTTVYVGPDVDTLPTAPGIRYNSIRLANAQIVSMPTITITGDLHVMSGRASFGPSTTFGIGGKLRTTSTGTIEMTAGTATVTVADSAIFTGGSTTGLLSAGLLRLQGDFVQGGASSSAFRAIGAHQTEFSGGVQQNVTMVNAGAGATNSRFAILELGQPMVSGANLQLQTDVFAAFLRDTTAGFADVIGSPVGALLSADTAWATNTRFNGTRLALTGGGPLTTLSSLTFENMDPTSTYLYVDLNEASPMFINGVTFTTVPTTGYYLQANQLNQSATPSAATLDLNAPVNPADPGGRYLRTSSVGGILPNVTWLGVSNP